MWLPMAKNTKNGRGRLDDAARAGWLYYVAHNNQDEIAEKMGISRQSAQRLVSLAMRERLIKFRLDHPIASCMELGQQLRERYGIDFCEVTLSDPMSDDPALGIAEVATVAIADIDAELAEATAESIGAEAYTVDALFAKYEHRPPGEKKRQVAGQVPFGRMGLAEDLVGMAIFLASAESDYIVSQSYNVDGGNWMS